MTKKNEPNYEGAHLFSGWPSGGNANVSDPDKDYGYRIGEVVKHMNSSQTTYTIMAFVSDNDGIKLKDNQTGKTKNVTVYNLDTYWSKHEPKPVRIWTPGSGWTK